MEGSIPEKNQTMAASGDEEELMDTLGEVEEFEWNAEYDVHLFESMLGYKPLGVARHFRMISIAEKFRNSANINCTSDLLWARLNTYYDIENLNKTEGIPFPNDESEFTLPEGEFGDLMRERKKNNDRKPEITDEVTDIKPGETSGAKETFDNIVEEQDADGVEKTLPVEKESLKDSTENVNSDIKAKDHQNVNTPLAKEMEKLEVKAKPSLKVPDKDAEKEIKTL